MAAQAAADSCDVVLIKDRGTNLFYNTSRLPEDSLQRFQQVLERWMGNDENVQQVRITLIVIITVCLVAEAFHNASSAWFLYNYNSKFHLISSDSIRFN